MKNIFSKKPGFSLAEVCIVFLIIGIVSLGFVGIDKIKKDTLQKQMSYAAFNSLRTLSGRNTAEGNELVTTTPEISGSNNPKFLACSAISLKAKHYNTSMNAYCSNINTYMGGAETYYCDQVLQLADNAGITSTFSTAEMETSYSEYLTTYNAKIALLSPEYVVPATGPPTKALIGGIDKVVSEWGVSSTGVVSVPDCEQFRVAVPGTTTTTVEKALPETGAKLCEKASDTYNIIGATHCTDGSIVDDSSDFSTATPNFVTTNSIAFYNFSSNPTAGTAGDYSTQLYTVYADINGVKKGKSKLNEDVLKFTLRRDGVVLPAADSIIANSKDYLSAAVKYDTFADKKRITNWIGTGLVFREAACTTGLASGDYCSARAKYPTAYSKNAACTTNACTLLLSNPMNILPFRTK